jgi:cysteine-rich repeat protein
MLARRHLLTSALPALLLATSAHAVRPPDHLAERPLEVASGPAAHVTAQVTGRTPAAAVAALDRFRAAHGAWQVLWDADAVVPLRLWGEGIAAPGALADPAVAEARARAVLAEQLALLAPGARLDDFEVLQNVVRADVRSVVFGQRWQDLEVVDARIRFTFKHDRLVLLGSTASPHIAATLPGAPIARSGAGLRARRWIEEIYGEAPQVIGAGTPVVLPIRRAGGLEHRVVVPVEVDLAAPRAEWTVYVDAGSGEPVARRQGLLFAEGTVRYRVPARHPGGGYQELPAAFTRHTVAGVAVTSNAAGVVAWAGTAATTVLPGLTGPYARVFNAAGDLATAELTLQPDGAVTWDLAAIEHGDAQLTAFIHANLAKQYALTRLDPGLAWLSRQIPVYVNENGTCNAYSRLDDIHFFVAGSGCANTARLADVVYHEFGHSLHGQSYGFRIDGSLSEGLSDYYAATITDDPAMGLGFFSGNSNVPLRHIDPEGIEYRYPEDFDEGRVHDSGLIIAGALWDLRKALVARYGQAAGVARADAIFYGVLSRADNIPSSYAEALVADDDDGNLGNGTPNQCAIDRAFGKHGLGPAGQALGASPPAIDGRVIRLDQPAASGVATCPAPRITAATATWRLRREREVGGTLDFTAAGDSLTVSLPEQPDGTAVELQVRMTLDDGSVMTFPANRADPWYDLYFGPVTPLYCTDFSRDPREEGWQLSGFDWGISQPPAGSDDPPAAFAGDHVIGNNLRGNYRPSQIATATSPVFDVTDRERVRLQYRRWLNVEDGLYDSAQIVVDGATVWSNLRSSTGSTHHRDSEWRFHDVDVTPLAGDGMLQVTFRLSSDEGLELGGWTIDSLCLVAEGAACGNGIVDLDETCDDGNTTDGDGCSSSCTLEIEEGGCCSTTRRGGPGGAILLGLITGAALLVRRRRGAAVRRA